MAVTFRVNGTERTVDVDPDTPLLWVLRDELGLTGTKYGCGVAQCGACTVHMDGMTRRSCVTPVKQAEDRDVVTIEGLESPEAEAIRAAWIEYDTPQCGYCQSGQIMTAVSLLSQIPEPTDADIDAALSGNICRCATYVRIRKAVKRASELMKA